MTHGLISSFDSVTCRKAILSNDLGSQAFSFLVNGTAVYLGILLVALSSVAYYGSAWCLIAIAAFIAYITRFQIVPEERWHHCLAKTSIYINQIRVVGYKANVVE